MPTNATIGYDDNEGERTGKPVSATDRAREEPNYGRRGREEDNESSKISALSNAVTLQ